MLFWRVCCLAIQSLPFVSCILGTLATYVFFTVKVTNARTKIRKVVFFFLPVFIINVLFLDCIYHKLCSRFYFQGKDCIYHKFCSPFYSQGNEHAGECRLCSSVRFSYQFWNGIFYYPRAILLLLFVSALAYNIRISRRLNILETNSSRRASEQFLNSFIIVFVMKNENIQTVRTVCQILWHLGEI